MREITTVDMPKQAVEMMDMLNEEEKTMFSLGYAIGKIVGAPLPYKKGADLPKSIRLAMEKMAFDLGGILDTYLAVFEELMRGDYPEPVRLMFAESQLRYCAQRDDWNLAPEKSLFILNSGLNKAREK